jgi:multiple sugar transport system substrate-binding protein
MRNGDWDVAFVATDWIAAAYEQGATVDLAPLLASDPPQDYPEGWTDSLLRLQRIGNSVLGVPYHDGPECLIYRRDLFKSSELRDLYEREYGEPLEPPRDWTSFHRVARFLHGRIPGLSGSVFAAYPDGHNTVYDFLLQMWTRGGELFDSAGQPRFHTQEAIDALTFYRAILNDSNAVHPECNSFDSVKAGLAFMSGQVAMMVNWFGFAALAHTAPESAVRGMVDVTTIPCAGKGSTVSLNVYWILSIASGSPHRDVAWQFLRHTLTAAMDKLTTTSGAIGCRKSTWHDPQINAEIPFYCRMEELHAVAREIPQRPDWPRIAAIIDKTVTETISSDKPIEEILDAADKAFRMGTQC